MNLTRIFGMQEVLDTRIIKEHGLEGQNLFYNMMQVEIGELANETRCFKHWSNKVVKRSYFNGVCRWISFYSFIRNGIDLILMNIA